MIELAGHPRADIAQLCSASILQRRQTPAAQRAEAIADLEQLIEVFGNHQNRRAGIAQGNQRAMDGGGGANVDAPDRVRSDQQFRLLKNFPAEDEFLQVAAGQAARGGLRVRGFHAEALDDLLREGFDFAALNQPVADQPVLKSTEQGVVGQT